MSPITLPFVGTLEPWQSVSSSLVGAPGLLVGVWVATLREPSRHEAIDADARAATASFPTPARSGQASSATHLATYGTFIVGTSVASLMWNGATA